MVQPITAKMAQLPDFANGTINLASARHGARGIYCTDEFFAPLERMLKDEPPIFLPAEYDENGKWMDGWESRRKRVPGHDWAVIQLARPGRVLGFDVDTTFFTGNYPPACSIEAAYCEGDPDEDTQWTEIIARTPLSGDSHHFIENADAQLRQKVWTHLKLHIYPDGGVARLRVYGAAHFDWEKVGEDEEVDLAYLFHGGRAIAWSDAHYGSPERLLSPGRGINMGDGWETSRRRGPGHDWTIIKLGHPGVIERVIVDTAFFKGNYPENCLIRAAYLPNRMGPFGEDEVKASEDWKVLLPSQKLTMDHIHEFASHVDPEFGPLTHMRFEIHPDGGVSRLRLFGKVFRG